MKRKITRKLRGAAEILTAEHITDDDPQFIINLYLRGKASAEQIYKAAEHFGYRWKWHPHAAEHRWTFVLPRWLETATRKRDREITDNWR